ncbi:MAG TPA: lipase maturation factor family protein [Acidobacteriaceae bacterium]|nr:lipase maturation factor family protein [Acidobacteriaceae bacterium]
MQRTPAGILRWLFDPQSGLRNRLLPRWLFLRALALIYFSAFYALLFQIRGLIGPHGILPAHQFLAAVQHAFGASRFWFAPTLYWISSGNGFLLALCCIGLAASLAALFNLWPRLSFFLCFLSYISFVAAAQTFSGYQSDGMLLAAGFLALFLSPSGLRPKLGAASPPARAAYFLLQWEWFRIYFESGLAKLLSGDQQWRHLTAMDQYYQNGPLPTWIGWYVQHLPHWFQIGTAGATLVMEMLLVFMLFLPRRARILCFLIVTPWEIGVILTANYTFLNYLVLVLGVLLLDDRFLRRFVPARLRPASPAQPELPAPDESAEPSLSILATERPAPSRPSRPALTHFQAASLALSTVLLTLVAYVTTAQLLLMPFPDAPLPTFPIRWLAPYRIANRYGLFAVMTHGRYEIEFQGSNDGKNWTPYSFRYKPQTLNQPPGLYAPYQPRFDWNLWFCSLTSWRQCNIVPLTEIHLLAGSPRVLHLFARNPFAGSPPRYVRAVLWQYWFTSMKEKHDTGNWWHRKLLGLYAPVLTLAPDGRPGVVQWPQPLPEHD